VPCATPAPRFNVKPEKKTAAIIVAGDGAHLFEVIARGGDAGALELAPTRRTPSTPTPPKKALCRASAVTARYLPPFAQMVDIEAEKRA